MNIKGIPIVTMGPGSQPSEDDGATLQYLDMPKGMSTYQRPDITLDEAPEFIGAWEAIGWLRGALAQTTADGPLLADLTGLDEKNRRLVNDVLGEGEVSITCSGKLRARIQESILTGVWRVVLVDPRDQVTRDILEVGGIPRVVRSAEPTRRVESASFADLAVPDSVVNAPSVLAELAAHAAVYEPGGKPHIVNLTLLPISEADLEFLDNALGRGAVEILSRSYGNCQMLTTAVPNIWWIRYFNSMGTLILNSLEVVDVPLIACAAPEDLADSARRLEDILGPQEAYTN